MAGGYARAAMARVKAMQKRNPKKTSFTATETGARRQAISNLASGAPSLGKFVRRAASKGAPKGAGAQFRVTSAEDVDSMIKKGGD